MLRSPLIDLKIPTSKTSSISILQWRAYNSKKGDSVSKVIRRRGKKKQKKRQKKTKKVAWFVSNCNARNKRLTYAKRLAKYIQVTKYLSSWRLIKLSRWISMASVAT